jgi:rubredoxin
VFEDLAPYEKRDEDRKCKLCGSLAKRNVAELFGIKTTLDPRRDTIVTPKEIDKVVGEKAEKKWEGYDERWRARYADRQKKRWGNKEPGVVNIPRDNDGKFTPIMHLGDKNQKAVRKEFVSALQEHRAERKQKGIPQFEAPGSISEK